MILLIDMGNQRLKWCCVEGDTVSCATGMAQCLAADNQAVSVSELLMPDNDAWQEQMPWNGPAPEQIWISAVSQNDAVDQVRLCCLSRWGIAPFSMTSPARLGALQNHYDRPPQLGVDRWLGALGAWTLCEADGGGSNLLVIDAGTAVTVDAVVESAFLGGAILPGLTLITDALGTRTGRIRLERPPLVNTREQSHDDNMNSAQVTPLSTTFATNSDDAVRAGAIAAVCGGVRYCVDRAVEQMMQPDIAGSAPIKLVVCGGDAALVADALQLAGAGRWNPQVVPNLVLAGLYASARACADESEGETS